MNQQFLHKLSSSFMVWLDWILLNKGQAYVNSGEIFTPQNDLSNSGPYIYASTHKQWVWDSSIDGANVISGVYGSNGVYYNRASGLTLDFINGRVISPFQITQPSGNYAYKEYNIYYSTVDQVNFYLEQAFGENNNLPYQNTGVSPYIFAAPCIIVTDSNGQNEPWAIGGMKNSYNTFRLYNISNNNYNQEGLNSLFNDYLQNYFPLVQNYDMPIGGNGDLKTGYYSYLDLMKKYGCHDVFLQDINYIKLSQKTNKQTNFYISITEFDLSTIRAIIT